VAAKRAPKGAVGVEGGGLEKREVGGGGLNEWQTGDGPAIEAVFCRVGLSSAGNLDSQVPI